MAHEIPNRIHAAAIVTPEVGDLTIAASGVGFSAISSDESSALTVLTLVEPLAVAERLVIVTPLYSGSSVNTARQDSAAVFLDTDESATVQANTVKVQTQSDGGADLLTFSVVVIRIPPGIGPISGAIAPTPP